MKKHLPKHHSQLSCSHYNTISDFQLQKRKNIPHAAAAARNLDAAIPLRSAQTELRNTIELPHTTVELIALMHQFQCTKCRNTCKTQKHSVNKEEKKPPAALSSTARANRAGFGGKAATPKTVVRASQLSLQRNIRLPEKTQCFVQILTFKSHL